MSQLSARYKFNFIFTVLLILVSPVYVSSQIIETACEKSGYDRYTSYSEMLRFLQQIDTFSTEIFLDDYGTTLEGRELPYAVFSRPYYTEAEDAVNSGKPIVVLAANIHGGERSLRESNMILIRELATPGSEMNTLLDSLVIIMVPSINPDGFVNDSRYNSLGVDLNRDFMKIEHQSTKNYIQNILHEWDPHIVIEGHNGGSYPYNICYLAPSNATVDQRIPLLADRELFPFIDERMEANGYKSWYYSRGNSSYWTIGGSDPRIGRNYGGFADMITILFETPSGYSRKVDVLSGLVAYKAVLQYAASNSQKITALIDSVRSETIRLGENAEGDIPLQQEYVAENYTVSYEIYTGGQIVQVTGAQIMKKPSVTKSRPRPFAYLLESNATDAIAMLERQNVAIETLQSATDINIEGYMLTGITRDSQYDHPNSAETVSVEATTSNRTITFPAGTFVVKTGQTRGRVLSHLLEPESNDNVITWNTMDNLLPDPADSDPVIPIYKLMTPTVLLTDEFVADEKPERASLPEKFTLHQNYPNPFNPVTIIKYQLPKAEHVRITVYNILGQEVTSLVDSPKEAGYHEIQWDATNISSGIYLYRMTSGNSSRTKRMILIR
ncbi:MAG: DUF2817 domain-containing protein [Planctomycetes bacterium]|nr:DUF2817 domain-containing protein [Planctomycetota bacterium]